MTSDPFILTLEDFRTHMDANAGSAYLAAQAAVKGWTKTGTGGTFFFTGNGLNVLGKPDVLVYGMCKSASAHMIHSASIAYADTDHK